MTMLMELGAVVVGGDCNDEIFTSQRPSDGFQWSVRMRSLEVLNTFNASFVNKAEQPTSHNCPMETRDALLMAG